MVLLQLLLACGGPSGCAEAEVEPSTASSAPALPPEPTLGVPEVVTPPGLVRAAEVQEVGVNADLDIWFDPTVTTFEALGSLLEGWGFVLLDGDGESWRVTPPNGALWEARLEPLPEVLRVREALDREPMETGAFREGRAQYGALVHSWAWREGGPVEQVAGGAAPPAPELPGALPDWASRCLSGVMDEMKGGVTRGVGWERALRPDPAAWVLVVQRFGGCEATGWLPLVADGDLGNLQVAGRPLAGVQPGDLHAAAEATLRMARADDDPWGATALALLDGAPADVLRRVAESSAPGVWQERLLRGWLDADPEAALAWARASAVPQARALLVLHDGNDRAAALADPATPPVVVRAALSAWRPGPGEGTEVLARLRASPDVRVRELAWERTMDQEAAACLPRAATLAAAAANEAAAAWRSCPLQDVRAAAFARLQQVDTVLAGKLVEEALTLPEGVPAGIAAARMAAELGRVDLLEAAVQRRTVPREPRREALRLLLARGAPNGRLLADAHARYLGLREEAPPMSSGGFVEGGGE